MSGGIWTFYGIDLRITNIGFTIVGDEVTAQDAQPLVRLDTWPFWGRQAIESATVAAESALAIREFESHNDSEVIVLMRRELQSAMTAISAAAFTFEALHSAIAARSPIDPMTSGAWQENRTPRARRIFETMKRCFVLGSHTTEVQRVLDQMFDFRRQAVHPPTEYAEPVLEPELGVGTAPLVVRFRAENAKNATNAMVALLLHLFQHPKPSETKELREWAATAVNKAEAMKTHWMEGLANFEPLQHQSMNEQ